MLYALKLVVLFAALCRSQHYRASNFHGPPANNQQSLGTTAAPRSWQWSRTWSDVNKEGVEQRSEMICPGPPDDPQCQQRWVEKHIPPKNMPPKSEQFMESSLRPLVPPMGSLMAPPQMLHQMDGPNLEFGPPPEFLPPQPPVVERATIIKELPEARDQGPFGARPNSRPNDPYFSTGPRFGFLDDQARKAILENCRSGRVDCRAQPDDMQAKKSAILQREMSLYQNEDIASSGRGPGSGYGYGRRGYIGHSGSMPMAEKRLSMIQTLKQSLLDVAGISADVSALDDGTFQQDVLLTEHQSTAMIKALKEVASGVKRHKRASIFFEEFPNERWDLSEPIPYYFDNSLEEYERQMVRQALNSLQSSTCIIFEERISKPAGDYLYYVKVASPTFCGLSYIGKVKPLNPIYLSFACQDPVGVATHETMHSLGVLHQHLRADRDNYLQIQWSNINPQLYDYFAIADPTKFTSYGTRYDYSSIMHYAPFTGALDSTKPTMIPKFDRELNLPRMGQRKVLGPADIELLNNMYCKPECRDRSVYCGVWALRNLCARPAQSDWMSLNCRKSCNLC